MGQRPSCCDEGSTHGVIPEVIQHSTWPSEQEQDDVGQAGQVQTEFEEEGVTDSGAASLVVSRKSRNLFTLKHFKIDRSLLRGIPLRESLRAFGRLWIKSPVDLREAAWYQGVSFGLSVVQLNLMKGSKD